MTFLSFTEIHDTGKTKVWSVWNSNDGSELGVIKWHGAWRKYVLAPESNCIWSPDCLKDAADFIEARMADRRKKPDPADPTDLRVPPFKRTVYIDFENDKLQQREE